MNAIVLYWLASMGALILLGIALIAQIALLVLHFMGHVGSWWVTLGPLIAVVAVAGVVAIVVFLARLL